jgi:hypothetical protein
VSVRTVACKFVDLCRQGKNFDVMRTLYAPDIGERVTREEVAVYTVENDKIMREQFFYDGAH